MPRQNNARTAVTIARLAMRSTTERLLPLGISMICTLLTLYGLFTVYGTGMGTGAVKGMELAAVLWSLGMYSMYWALGTRHIFRDITSDVKDGSIETKLVKPMHYLLWRVAHRLGKQAPLFVQQVVLNVTFLLLFIGVPVVAVSPFWVIALLGLLFFGSLVAIFLFTMVGLCAFWIEDAHPVMWIMDKFSMILGGAFVPIALFPSALRAVAEWSPFGAMLAFTQAFTPEFLVRAPMLFLSQVVWIVVLFGGMTLMWRAAMHRVAINGG